MSKLYCDNDKYGYQCDFPISEAYNSAVKDLVRRSYEEFGGKWEDIVFKREFDFIKKEDMLEIESLKTAIEITDEVFTQIIPELKVGAVEKEISAKISYLFKQ